MIHNEAGRMLDRWWHELPDKFGNIELDEHQVMPNHFHGIIRNLEEEGQPHRVAPTLGDIVGWFETMVTNEYIRGVKTLGWHPFPGRLLQRNYYEHIVRNERDLERIRYYIRTNPKSWELDKENPERIGEDEFDLWLASFKDRPDQEPRQPPP